MSTGESSNSEAGDVPPSIITVPWSAATFPEVKGILSPSAGAIANLARREALLHAAAKARNWINDLVEGQVFSFAEIAGREDKAERHIRLLARLAFVSPTIISEIVDRTACPNLTVTDLAIGIFLDRAGKPTFPAHNLKVIGSAEPAV